MEEQHKIIRQVYAAKEDVKEADLLISTYMPFIKAETAKFLKRPPIEAHDDELSIAMMAFYEAINGYSKTRGAFFKYAAMIIRSRLIDYARREKRHEGNISLDSASEEENPFIDRISDSKDHHETVELKESTRSEIVELTRQMEDFKVNLSDVADNCPKQQRTLYACHKALQYAQENPELLEELLKTKRLPISKLSAGCGIEIKTLERHRKYMVALLLIHTNGYEIIRGHLKQVMKGVAR